MHLVDAHAHLDHPDFSADLDTVLKHAAANGVVAVIAQGTNHESNQRVIALARQYPMVKAALGLYPAEAMGVPLADGARRETAFDVDTTLAYIEEHASEIVAIGEVGLDLKEVAGLDEQREVLRRILRLAKRLRKPVILHSRKAEEPLLDLLEEEQVSRAVLHCFMGSKKLLLRGIAMGLYFSIPSAVVRHAQFQQNAALIPLGQLLTETDAPYLAPMKDMRNEPSTVRDAVKTLADLKRMDPQELANALYFNYQKLFQ